MAIRQILANFVFFEPLRLVLFVFKPLNTKNLEQLELRHFFNACLKEGKFNFQFNMTENLKKARASCLVDLTTLPL